MQAIQPSVDRFLDDYVTELAPTWRSVGEEWAGMALLLGAPILALLQTLERLWHSRKGPVVLQLVPHSRLARSELRTCTREFPVRACRRVAGWHTSGRGNRPVAGTPNSFYGTSAPTNCLGIGWIPGSGSGQLSYGRRRRNSLAGNCSLETIRANPRHENLDSPDPIVLAGIPYGPELMWRLPVGVIGTPYLNPSGIEFTEAVFLAESVESAIARLNEREVDAIVVCEGEAGSTGYRQTHSFYTLLLADTDSWLGVISNCQTNSPFRIYVRS